MAPWTRRRLPPRPDRDAYESLASRIENQRWHPQGGPPRETVEVSEDAHFMLRCLYRHLPLERITKPTKSSKSEDIFARNYGRKFATYIREYEAVVWTGRCWRVRTDMMLPLVRSWFETKVTESGNTFQWVGFKMETTELFRITGIAHDDWLAGYR